MLLLLTFWPKSRHTFWLPVYVNPVVYVCVCSLVKRSDSGVSVEGHNFEVSR